MSEYAEPGQRQWSRITLEVSLAHDGSAELFGEHLALEVYEVVERLGADCCGEILRVIAVETVMPGDEASASLPAIRGTP